MKAYRRWKKIWKHNLGAEQSRHFPNGKLWTLARTLIQISSRWVKNPPLVTIFCVKHCPHFVLLQCGTTSGKRSTLLNYKSLLKYLICATFSQRRLVPNILRTASDSGGRRMEKMEAEVIQKGPDWGKGYLYTQNSLISRCRTRAYFGLKKSLQPNMYMHICLHVCYTIVYNYYLVNFT